MIRAIRMLGILLIGLPAPPLAAQAIDCPERPVPTAAAPAPADQAARWLEQHVLVLGLDGQPEFAPSQLRAAAADPIDLLRRLERLGRRCAELARVHPADPPARRQQLRAELLRLVGGAEPAAGAALEQRVALSARDLWRRVWFRDSRAPLAEASRWAVIVASPTSESAGLAWLADYQRRWPDVYFELQQPYRAGAPLALVVGRRLSQADASKLLAHSRSLGLPPDGFIWPVPLPAAAPTG
jgi:hypothetical protein